jgi:hypothetical protein
MEGLGEEIFAFFGVARSCLYLLHFVLEELGVPTFFGDFSQIFLNLYLLLHLHTLKKTQKPKYRKQKHLFRIP